MGSHVQSHAHACPHVLCMQHHPPKTQARGVAHLGLHHSRRVPQVGTSHEPYIDDTYHWLHTIYISIVVAQVAVGERVAAVVGLARDEEQVATEFAAARAGRHVAWVDQQLYYRCS